jgi:hypothetical protein
MDVPGGHLDLVTGRIGDLADGLTSWLSGDGPPEPKKRSSRARKGKVKGALTGSTNPQRH